MKLQLIKLRDSLADSFWFLPACMAVIAAIVAFGLVALDHRLGGGWFKETAWAWSGGPDGGRSVLSTIAGSLMTVISIVFSLTISALAQTSSHFGPRVLRNFTSDRFVQFTLGTFISTFVYCLLVLRTVRSIEEAAFVPYLSVNLGVVLAIASLAVLIFFIHHIAQSIQAENLIADVGQDFQSLATDLFPRQVGQPQGEVNLPDDHWQHAYTVTSPANGYLQRIDAEQLIKLAKQHDLQLNLEKRPGEFVSHHSLLLKVVPPSRMNQSLDRKFCRCFVVGLHRTPYQDALYSIQQLVEIAAHALSPGINEPFTALSCIDWLGASLRRVLCSDLPSVYRFDEDGQVRVVARPVSFEEMARTAFDQIRIYSANMPEILISLLNTITDLASDAKRPCDREILAQHVQLIGQDSTQITNSTDKERVLEHVQKALHALNNPSCPLP